MVLSHTDKAGKAKMVDVSAKAETHRIARASGLIRMACDTIKLIKENQLAKGDVLGVARIAGILAAKKTDELIPLCHSLPLTSVTVNFEYLDDKTLKVSSEAIADYKTGVEMEALVACSVAALTVYDMVKAVDKAVEIDEVHLDYKSGGKSGEFVRPAHER